MGQKTIFAYRYREHVMVLFKFIDALTKPEVSNLYTVLSPKIRH